MKTKLALKLAAAALLLSTINHQLSTCFAQGTAFTYQGRLNDGTNPATGNYDLTFALFTVNSGPGQVGSTLTNAPLGLTNGLFTVTLDFGNQFPGANRWLEIAARTNGGGAFATLSPRQKLTATPYAITAGNVTGVLPAAGLAGSYSSAVTLNNAGNQFNGAFSGNGASVSNVNALTLGGLGAANFWKTAGNAGTTAGTHFLGTTDNQPLELKVNGQRVLRLEPNTNGFPNIIGGYSGNFVAAGVSGATIAGGGSQNKIYADFGAIGGGSLNQSGSRYATIAGGFDNIILGYGGTIGGDSFNNMSGDSPADDAVIAGGFDNYVFSSGGTLSGGKQNGIGEGVASSVIGGGEANFIVGDDVLPGDHATIGGGVQNYIEGAVFSTISGGYSNTVTDSSSSAIGGGEQNTILSSAAAIAGGHEGFISSNSYGGFIGGGEYNNIQAGSQDASIAGGYGNTIGTFASASVIGGGEYNNIEASSQAACIAGGYGNNIGTFASASAIGGGDLNEISRSLFATVAGGKYNFITNSEASTIGGGQDNTPIVTK